MNKMVTTQRTMVHPTRKAVRPKPRCPSIPVPIDAPNTISAAAAPPRTTVASMSGIVRSRLATNLRSPTS